MIRRQELRKDLRRLTWKGCPGDSVREQINELSEQLKNLRQEAALCEGIALRSGRVKENLRELLNERVGEKAIHHKENYRRNFPR